MDGEIIFRTLKLFKVSFLGYCDYYINFIAVLSLLFAIFSAIFNISEFINSNFILSCIIIVFILCVIFIHYFCWYKNHFKKVNINIKALFVIEGRDNSNLSIEISKLVVPSENYLILTLMVEFGEFIKQELLNKSYTLLIKKPEDLNIKFMNNIKSNPKIIDDGLESSFYCINLKYKNNTVDELLFKLQADKTTMGCFSIYFLNEDVIQINDNENKDLSEYFRKVSSKRSPIKEYKIHSKDIEINNNDYIIIDKNN